MAHQPVESQRLIVVDGEVLVRHVISDYLRTCGYVVIEASSTDEAAIVLDDVSFGIDAVLCDADAPGGQSAFQLRAWALQRRPDVQVVLAGGVAAAANKAAELCEEGPQLRRPYDPQGVVDHIRRMIGSRAASKVGKA
jgi:DNA-binding NtrC family response regulator